MQSSDISLMFPQNFVYLTNFNEQIHEDLKINIKFLES